MRTLLDACGGVQSWKRASDPETNELKGFGFVEFEDAEGVLRAIRLLNGLKIDGQELMVKGNTATQRYLEAYELSKVPAMGTWDRAVIVWGNCLMHCMPFCYRTLMEYRYTAACLHASTLPT